MYTIIITISQTTELELIFMNGRLSLYSRICAEKGR